MHLRGHWAYTNLQSTPSCSGEVSFPVTLLSQNGGIRCVVVRVQLKMAMVRLCAFLHYLTMKKGWKPSYCFILHYYTLVLDSKASFLRNSLLCCYFILDNKPVRFGFRRCDTKVVFYHLQLVRLDLFWDMLGTQSIHTMGHKVQVVQSSCYFL